MAAPKGNKFWERRSSHGRKPLFDSPETLWSVCCEYFDWVDNNPLWEAKLTSYQGVNKVEKLPKMRAMTIEGLCLFLDIDQQTWANYRAKDDFLGVVTRAESVIRSQKFAGAAAELLNPNIIARDLGLKDGHEHTGANGGPIQSSLTVKFVRADDRDS